MPTPMTTTPYDRVAGPGRAGPAGATDACGRYRRFDGPRHTLGLVFHGAA
ncbi:hypothetical protein AB0D67_10585 [Streptosporangium sp. NPDC048047]